jgi:hypothetical protein
MEAAAAAAAAARLPLLILSALLLLLLSPAADARVPPPARIQPLATAALRRLYDTSDYGKLQLSNGLALTPQMGWVDRSAPRPLPLPLCSLPTPPCSCRLPPRALSCRVG